MSRRRSCICSSSVGRDEMNNMHANRQSGESELGGSNTTSGTACREFLLGCIVLSELRRRRERLLAPPERDGGAGGAAQGYGWWVAGSCGLAAGLAVILLSACNTGLWCEEASAGMTMRTRWTWHPKVTASGGLAALQVLRCCNLW
eukprot:6489071-Amphidinium_carterae.1